MKKNRRVTKEMLMDKIKTINEITGGNYTLEGAYGGWNIVKTEENRGISYPIRCEMLSKRELLRQLYVFLIGISLGRKIALKK